MDFEEWFAELAEYAHAMGHPKVQAIISSYFMYEEYHEDGKTPEEAYHEEWG